MTAVSDGDTVVLDGERIVRLAAVTAPKDGDTPMSGDLAEASRRRLEALVLDRTVVVQGRGGRQDRYGRTVAHLSLATDGTWVEQSLVREGWARVVTGPQEGPCAVALLGVEEEARRSERGVWARPEFAVRSATGGSLAEDRDRFVVVAGRVYSVRRAGRLTYINFGADHSRSLTATLLTSDEKLFINYGKDPASLVGQRVEMRGWIGDRGGPTMSLSHPDEIVVIGK
ncbi:MAG: thermonuclease family protein [Bauldia sp.]